MLKFDDRIAVAVSGGKDSLSLLHIFAKRERKFPKASLIALTVDEGIKGYRDEALKIARENCKKLGIKHIVVSFKKLFGYSLDEIAQKKELTEKGGLTMCACCGILRRKALNIAARENHVDKLATAHTLDDEAQTILLNMFHGDVWRIAKEKPITDEIHPKLVQRIKPFCEIPEKETALYAYVKNIKFQSKPCPYASEAMRNEVRAMLNRMEEKHAGLKFTIFKSVERIRQALDEINKRESLTGCRECGEPTSEKVCRACQLLKELRLDI
ncbi:TIGR00269 family protein [Candidatus Bathyarchaeota archaeon]|nr:TIGR00269 family protein [Candidatus Bathyarchaeota archaeon]